MSIKSSQYLYDTDIKYILRDPYEDVLIRKIHLGNQLMEKLVRINNMEDTKRMLAVSKAITFNTDLLFEVGYSYKSIADALKLLQIQKENNE